jgi:hypothetical protein
MRTLRFADVGALVPLGVDPARWQGFDYQATQASARLHISWSSTA